MITLTPEQLAAGLSKDGPVVVAATKSQCDAFVTAKHYSRRAGTYWAGFILLRGMSVEGVVQYGQPSPAVQKHAFADRDFRLYELNRLVIQSDLKNAASLLVGRSLQMLPVKPCAVVSYADSEFHHCGIVYQATNWVYTGATVSHDKAYIVDGKRVHPLTLRDRGINDPGRWARENGIATVPPEPKHRYFFFIGDKRARKAMARKLRYPAVTGYPKMDQRRYDDGPKIETVI